MEPQEVVFDFILNCFCSPTKPIEESSNSRRSRRRRRKQKSGRGRSRTRKQAVNGTFDADSTKSVDTRFADCRNPKDYNFDENSIYEDATNEFQRELHQCPRKRVLKKKHRGRYGPKSMIIEIPRHSDIESDTQSDTASDTDNSTSYTLKTTQDAAPCQRHPASGNIDSHDKKRRLSLWISEVKKSKRRARKCKTERERGRLYSSRASRCSVESEEETKMTSASKMSLNLRLKKLRLFPRRKVHRSSQKADQR